MKDAAKLIVSILAILFATSLILNLAACGVLTQATEYSGDASALREEGVLNIKFEPDDIKNGFIYIRCSPDAIEDTAHKYVVSLQNKDDLDSKQGCGYYYQFTLNYFSDWIRCPLPFENTQLLVERYDAEKYDKAFEEDIEYAPSQVERISILGVGDYKKCIDNFNQKTALAYWTDEQEAEVNRLMNLGGIAATDNDEFAAETFVCFTNAKATNDRECARFTSDPDKKGQNRPCDKQYDILIHKGVLEKQKGMCSDLSAVYTVALRSRGIPCAFVEGVAQYNEAEGPHAWVLIADENGELNVISDPMRGIDRDADLTGEYTQISMK